MNWLHELWFGYGWPSLQGNGPEAVIELVGLAILGSLIWPPTRKAIANFMHRHTDELHAKLDHNADLMHHIIKHHPSIPDYKEKK